MLPARPGLPGGARDPHFPKHTTIQLFPPLSPHRHRSPSRDAGYVFVCPGIFSSLHLKQLIDLRLGEQDGEGEGGEGRNTSVQNPRHWSHTRFSSTEYIVAAVIMYSPPPLIKNIKGGEITPQHPRQVPRRGWGHYPKAPSSAAHGKWAFHFVNKFTR